MTQLNIEFEKFFNKLKKTINKDIDKGVKGLLYLCYVKGYKDAKRT